MTLSLLDLGNGPSSPTPGPRWPTVVGAVLVAAALLFAGPLRCTAPLTMPPHAIPMDGLATGTTTWTPSTEGTEG